MALRAMAVYRRAEADAMDRMADLLDAIGRSAKMSADHHDIFLRAHTVQLEKKQHTNTRRDDEPKWPDYALIFDCESRASQQTKR